MPSEKQSSRDLLIIESERRIKEFCLNALRKFQPDLKGNLYHYTDGEGLVGIFKSQKLRASNIYFMNDASEHRYAVDLFISCLASRANNDPSPHLKKLFAEAKEQIEKSDDGDAPNVFVFCFSAKRDDLSQWRGYGGDETSYCLAFDHRRLLLGTNEKYFLAQCIYCEIKQRSFIQDALTLLGKQYLDAAKVYEPSQLALFKDELLRLYFWNLQYFLSFFKHPSFKDEDEWRLIQFHKPNVVDDIVFVPKRSHISGYVEFDVKIDSPAISPALPIPITEVIIGPGGNRQLSKIAIKALTLKMGFGDNFLVTISPCPYRPA